MRIYTLGTSLRTEAAFIEILKHYRIEALLDVRSFPRSKIPTYNRDYLEPLMTANGIAYHFLGKTLGGFRNGGYEAYMKTGAFHAGIDRAEEIARGKQSVIVCAEKLPWKCHRRYIARELNIRGWKTPHILEIDKVWEPVEPISTKDG